MKTIVPALAGLMALSPLTAHATDAVAALATEVRHRGWIVSGARTPAGDWDLFLMRPDGSSRRNITNTPGHNEGMARFSPDGGRLLYRRLDRAQVFDNNRHGAQGKPIIAGATGAAPQELGGEGELPWATFSPDGRQVACLERKHIAIVDLATRKVVRTLPRVGFYQQMIWSPDGRWLTGVANNFTTAWSVARIEVSTGQASAVARVDSCTPDWFPGSDEVIFSHRPGKWTQLWRVRADGTDRRVVHAEEGRHVYGGCVSPDGRYALFTGNKLEDGDAAGAGAPMGLLRLGDAPGGVILPLPVGWEPHWTFAEVVPEETPSRDTRKKPRPRRASAARPQ